MFQGPMVMFATAVTGVAVVWLVNRGIAGPAIQVLPFQSGWLPQEHALSRYHVRWYLATLLFLAFDVEMLFMYPWAVVVADLGGSAVVEMFLFLGGDCCKVG